MSDFRTSLELLPCELHLRLADFLPPADLICLSQLSRALRSAYHPIVWTYATLTDDDTPPHHKISLSDTRYRFLPVRAFVFPQKYAWLCSRAVSHVVMSVDVAESCLKEVSTTKSRTFPNLFQYPLDATSYPSLRSVEIGNTSKPIIFKAGLSTRILLIDTIDMRSFTGIMSSKFYTSCNALSPRLFSMTCPLTVSRTNDDVQEVESGTDCHNSSHTKAMRVTLKGWTTSLSFFRNNRFENLETITIDSNNDELLLELILNAANWPKLRHFTCTSSTHPTNNLIHFLKYLHHLPKTLETVILALFSISHPAEIADVTETFQIPRVTHLQATLSQIWGILIGGITYHPHYSDLRHLALSVVGQLRSTYSPFDPSTLTSLSLYMPEGTENSHIGIPLQFSPKDFVSLKCVKLQFAEHKLTEFLTVFLARLKPAFCKMRDHYKISSEPPSAAWLKKLFAAPELGGFGIAYPVLSKALESLFTQPESLTDIDAVLIEHMHLPICAPIIHNIAFAEWAVRWMMDLPNLAYLSIDTNGPSYIIPGLYRILGHHPTLKQALIVTLPVEEIRTSNIPIKPVNPQDKGHSGTAALCGSKNKLLYQYTTPMFDSHFSSYSLLTFEKTNIHYSDRVYSSIDYDAQILVDVARKRNFRPNMITTFPTGRPIPGDIIHSTETLRLFTSEFSKGDGYFDEMCQMREFQGWI